MSSYAVAKNILVSPRKAGAVAELVRGRSVAEAITILEHTPRRSAKTVMQVIASAKANAEHNHSYKPETLTISRITVTAGTRYKRYRPAARGRALPYQRKTSHIRVEVDGQKRTVKPKTTASAPKQEAK